MSYRNVGSPTVVTASPDESGSYKLHEFPLQGFLADLTAEKIMEVTHLGPAGLPKVGEHPTLALGEFSRARTEAAGLGRIITRSGGRNANIHMRVGAPDPLAVFHAYELHPLGKGDEFNQAGYLAAEALGLGAAAAAGTEGQAGDGGKNARCPRTQ